jgi:hypothetical protein
VPGYVERHGLCAEFRYSERVTAYPEVANDWVSVQVGQGAVLVVGRVARSSVRLAPGTKSIGTEAARFQGAEEQSQNLRPRLV